MQNTKTQEFLQSIITKAWQDETFKQQLIANPLITIEKLTGKKINLPEGKTIVVQDQTDTSKIYLNIPPKLNLDDVGLSEEQLEAVAGGVEDDEHNGYSWWDYVRIKMFGWE